MALRQQGLVAPQLDQGRRVPGVRGVHSTARSKEFRLRRHVRQAVASAEFTEGCEYFIDLDHGCQLDAGSEFVDTECGLRQLDHENGADSHDAAASVRSSGARETIKGVHSGKEHYMASLGAVPAGFQNIDGAMPNAQEAAEGVRRAWHEQEEGEPKKAAEQVAIKALVDRACPLCQKQAALLRSKDKEGKIMLVDISDPSYRPEENANISFDEAMTTIHAIMPDGTVLEGVDALSALYSAVGLGWLFSLARVPVVRALMDAVYLLLNRARGSPWGNRLAGLADMLLSMNEGIDSGGESCRVYSDDGSCADAA